MGGMRIYELAKELGLDNKEVIRKAQQLEIPVKSHMANLDEDEVSRIVMALASQAEVAAPKIPQSADHKGAPEGAGPEAKSADGAAKGAKPSEEGTEPVAESAEDAQMGAKPAQAKAEAIPPAATDDEDDGPQPQVDEFGRPLPGAQPVQRWAQGNRGRQHDHGGDRRRHHDQRQANAQGQGQGQGQAQGRGQGQGQGGQGQGQGQGGEGQGQGRGQGQGHGQGQGRGHGQGQGRGHGNDRGHGRGFDRDRGNRFHRDGGLSSEDPYWQFGTPVDSWGSSRRRPGDAGTGDPSGLAPDDPYWTFGSPPDTWGSSRKKDDQQRGPRPDRPRVHLECKTCGVKVERKAAHGRGKVPCPFCNKWMVEVRTDR